MKIPFPGEEATAKGNDDFRKQECSLRSDRHYGTRERRRKGVYADHEQSKRQQIPFTSSNIQ